jgi:hypothetical protein
MPGWVLSLVAVPFSLWFVISEIRKVRQSDWRQGRGARVYLIALIMKYVFVVATFILFVKSNELESSGTTRAVWEPYWHASIAAFILAVVAATIQAAPRRNDSRD